jgi:hypothetical protein
MTTNTTKKRPTHRVFHELRSKEGKTLRSSEVGAIWPHSDGQGFSMKLDYLPVGGNGWFAIRVIEEGEDGAA